MMTRKRQKRKGQYLIAIKGRLTWVYTIINIELISRDQYELENKKQNNL